MTCSSRHHRSLAPVFFLTLLALLFFCSPSLLYADLGLSSKDFGSKRVTGKKVSGKGVTGVGIKVPDDDSGNTNPNPIDPIVPAPPCFEYGGNADEESATCSDNNCAHTNSYVNLINREYQDDIIDLAVKAPGGFLKIQRIHANKRWQFEHDYNKLSLQELDQGIIHKGSLIYTRNDAGEYSFRDYRINTEENGFRWQNRTGSYTLYSPKGLLLESGNRNGVLARYTYNDKDQVTAIHNRRHEKVFTFHYAPRNPNPVAVTDTHNRVVRYTWQENNLLSVTNVLGHKTTYHYNPNTHQLVSKADETGRKFFITYYKDGAVKSVLSRDDSGFYFSYTSPLSAKSYAKVTSSEGQEQEFWFDEKGYLTKAKVNGHITRSQSREDNTRTVVDELDNHKINTFDNRGNLLSIRYADGTTISHEYDNLNNRIRTINELGIETRYGYDKRGNLLFTKEAYLTNDERIREYEYDKSGNPVITRLFDNDTPLTTRAFFDANDNLIKTIDPLGVVTEFSYDYMGNLSSSSVAGKKTLTSSYDPAGQLIRTETPGIPAITFTYDPAGRKTAETVEGLTTKYSYDYRDNLLSIENPLGSIERSTYDLDNRLIGKMDAEGIKNTYVYNKNGQVEKIIDGAGNRTVINYATIGDCGRCPKTFSSNPAQIIFPTFERQYQYDRRGRMVKESNINDGKFFTSTFTYDKAGRLLSSTDPSGHTTSYSYDNLNRLASVTDPDKGITKYAYNSRDNLVTVTDAMGKATSYDYDELGRLIKEVYPLGNSISYSYDELGRLATKIDGNNQTTLYNYNEGNNRLDSLTLFTPKHEVTKRVKFSYDTFGRLLSYDDGITKGSYGYDKIGRKIKEEVNYGPFKASHGYSYYRNNQKKKYQGPDGNLHRYMYNNIGKLSRLEIDNVGVISIGSYNWQRPGNITLPGNQRQSFSYDGFQRLTGIKGVSPKDPALLSFEYSYNPTSNITAIKSPKEEISYTYDPLQRLTGILANNKEKEQYTYDPVHNRIASMNENYLYDDNNRLLDIGDRIRHDYDTHGNLVAKRFNEQVVSSYSYDVENRLTDIETGEARVRYSYDPFGRRISKEVEGQKTFFHYSDEGLVAELDEQGKIIHSYSWRPGSAWSTNPIVMLDKGKTPYFYYNNHLGAPVKLTDKEGTVVWSATYTAFGKAEINLAKVTNNLRLPGQYFDKETGLHYNFQRYYDAETGRYITADPIGLDGGINLYAYVQGDPVNWIDPLGLLVETGWDVVNVGLGIVSFTANVASGNYWGAAFDVGGLLYDGFATAIPGLPAGAGFSLQVYRGGKLAPQMYAAYQKTKNLRYLVVRGAEHAHHIIPHTKWKKELACLHKNLAKWDIDINSAINGIGLPKGFHRRMHDEIYFRRLQRLEKLQTKEALIGGIEDLAQELLRESGKIK